MTEPTTDAPHANPPQANPPQANPPQTDPPHHDLLGKPLQPTERELLELHGRLQALAEHAELPPCATHNVRQALVLIWNVCNDLALTDARPRSD